NNTAQDGTPYFLTADHCLTGTADAINNPNLGYWSFYWDYESSGCSDGLDFTPPSTNGATVVANNGTSDFALLELTETPSDAGVTPYYNGWDRRNLATSTGVGIHHPAGDIKKIATHTQTPSYSSSIKSPSGNYWQVSWSATPNGFSVTEGGSSGSPLFNTNSHIIGQLWGGSSINCSNPAADPGVYGKIYASWNGSTDTRRRLRDWLDPSGTAPNTLDGSYISSCDLNLTITSTITSGTQVFEASNNITGSNIIDGTADVTYDAGNAVILTSGFHARSGVDFTAKLGGCTESANQMVQAYAVEEMQRSDDPTGMSSIGTLIYPNPGDGVFNVVLNENYLRNSIEPVSISLYDLKGQMLREEVLKNTNKAVFDITDNPAGVYLIRISKNDSVETFRIVLQ
ncbi:MAG: 3-coathanger stack domain-containing protein, partial [Cyclobacteriaceae bacterium]